MTKNPITGTLDQTTNGVEKTTQSKVVKTKLTLLGENFIKGLQTKLNIGKTSNIPFFNKINAYNFSNGTTRNNDGHLCINTLHKNNLHKLIQVHKKNSRIGNFYNGQESILGINFISGTPLFEIKQVYTQDDFYIFEDSDGNFFHANISDFNKNGIQSDSLKLGKPPLNTTSNIVSGFTIDNTQTSINLIKNNKVVSTLVGDLIVVVDNKKGDVIVVNDNHIEYINIDSDGKQTDGNPFATHYGTIKKMRIDNHYNFLLLISEYDGGETKLHIVNRKTLHEIKTFDDISDIIQIDNKDDLTCLTSDGKVASVDTNFDQFEIGYVDNGGEIIEKKVIERKDAAKEALLETLGNGGLQVDINGLQGNHNKHTTIDKSHQDILDKIWQTKVGESTLKELFDEANSNEKIELVYSILLQIKSNPLIIGVSGITDSIEKAINFKRFTIKLQEIKESLLDLNDMYEQVIEELNGGDYSSFPILLTLKTNIEELKKSRSQLPIIDNELDINIKELSNKVETQILSFRIKNSEVVKTTISENILKIKDIISNIEYLSQLTQIYSTDIYLQTENLIELLQDDEKDKFKDELKNTISSRITEIGNLEKIKEKDKETKLREKVEEIEDLILGLSEVIDSITDGTVLDSMSNSDPLVIMIKGQLNELPKSEAERLSLTIDNLFNSRKGIIKMKQLVSVGVKSSLNEYGIDTSLYYTEVTRNKIGFKLGGHRTANGNIRLEIEYDGGIKFNIDSYLHDPSRFAHAMAFDEIEGETSQNDFIKLQSEISSWQRYGIDRFNALKTELGGLNELIGRKELTIDEEKSYADKKRKIIENIHNLKKKYLNVRKFDFFAENLARKLNLNPRTNLKQINPNFIVLEEEKEIFKKISIGFKIQKNARRGIDILEGPPGLGKTVMCEYFAAATNREVIRVQCHKGMEITDLLFADSLKAGETRKEIADWVKLMQKPGTMIIFDEIDLLSPQVLQTLHRLFDTGRSVHNPQIGEIKANSDCLFIGTCNSYEKLSSPLVSRSRINKIKYPGELNEAYKVSKYTGIDFFNKLSFNDFKVLWENIGDQKGGNKNNIIDKSMKTIYDNLDRIKNLVAFFNELRTKQSSDDYDEKFIYEISYRDASDIFDLFIHQEGVSFKNIVLDVVVPKARKVVYENEDKDTQEKIVRKIVEKIF
nr:AAA family ATPase [Candidatus Gracilibacteria bacterium]